MPWATSKDLGVYELADTEDHITAAAARQYTRTVPAGALLIATRGMALAKRLPVGMTTRSMAFNQVVENPDLVFLIEQHLRADAANVTCAANNKNLHPWKRFALRELFNR